MASNELFSCEEALGGLPLRRASFLLFLIESRTARMVAHSQQAAEFSLSEEVARERDLAFLGDFALGRGPSLRPTIQDLGRYAPRWAQLAPQNPRLLAAIAHLLGRKCRFTCEDIPGIRAALGLDGEAVPRAFSAAFNRSLPGRFGRRSMATRRSRRPEPCGRGGRGPWRWPGGLRLVPNDLLLQGCNAVVVELEASLQRPTYTVSAFQR
jgi:hypothetical protein